MVDFHMQNHILGTFTLLLAPNIFSNKLTYNGLAYIFNLLNGLQMIQAAILLRSLV